LAANRPAGSPNTPREFDIVSLRASLLSWYDRERRTLPWREHPSVYGTWISEIMLQQTTVAAVEPRWLAFMARFPDVRALAAADEAEVLNAWSGLGYYRRARQLHAAARAVVDDFAGDLPDSEAGWKTLPGIGPYTAGAIASIGLGEPVPAVDTNVVRVLTRLACDSAAEAAGMGPAQVRRLAADMVDPDRPGDWNQALMDLGAGPCAVVDPGCGACPLAASCRAKSGGVPGSIPPAKPRVQPIPCEWSLLVARTPDGILLAPQEASPAIQSRSGTTLRTDYAGLYRGYRSLPFSAWRDSARADPEFWLAWWTGLGGAWREEPRLLGSFRHAITRYRLKADIIAGELVLPGDRPLPGGYEVVSHADLDRLALSPPSLRALALTALR